MANQEQLDLLKQGVEIWNQWRQECSSVEGANLECANLINADLEGADLEDANLKDANLSGSSLRGAILIDANLSGSNLISADLGGANLSGADLSSANLWCANLISANLGDANLMNANLSNADLSNADLSSAYLDDASLSDANMSGANLRNADLSDADLSSANLSSADLSSANLSNADLSSANLEYATLISADLEGANLRNADLSSANLNDANLSGIDPSNVDLSKIDLSSANLSGIDLSGEKFSRIDLSNVDLWGLKLRGVNLSKIDLSGIDFSDVNIRDIDLSGIDFRGVNLSGIDLSGELRDIDLSRMDFSDADLHSANLSDVNLNGVNLSKANLSGVDFTRTQALATNFTSATLTGACLEDWNINSKTNLDGVICEYVYLKQRQQERRPSSGSFKSGEFTALFQKALETVDLIFADGIDWKAFFTSFQELKAEYGDDDLSIQAIEKKSGGAFIIRLEVLAGADKVAIESRFKEGYEMRLQFQEELHREKLQAKDGQILVCREQLEFQRQNDTSLMEIMKTMAEKDNQTTIHATNVGFINSGSGTVSKFTQNIGNNLDDITKLINTLRETAQAFPEAQREETLGHLGDLEDDLKQPNDRTPRRIKATLAALLAIAGIVAASTDFSNNVLEISNKLGIELIQPHKQQLPRSANLRLPLRLLLRIDRIDPTAQTAIATV